MTKRALFPLLLVVGCLVAGAYGALHDQISYAVSPDYFHVFKFDQFRFPEEFRTRLGASVVGWLASWWMGLFIGVPVLSVGLVLPDGRTYLRKCLTAYAVAAGTALGVGLTALAVASVVITESNLPPYWYPAGVTDKVAFARVGTMHNFSYLGGFMGIVTASIYLLLARWRLSRRRTSL